jgi:hypothetical protein
MRIAPRSACHARSPLATEFVSMLEALLELVVARHCALRTDPGQT